MELAEHIEKAKQMVSMLRDDIFMAHNMVAAQPEPPSGISSIRDKALMAYLAETMEMANKLESKLAQL